MQKRKSHNKSRNGCTNCKLRHVKCDEQGPPCANCVSRKITDCTYSTSRRASPTTTASSSSAATTTLTTSSPQPATTAVLSSSNSLSPKPPFFDSPPELSTLFQLELMHRWSTCTYKSLISVPPDEYYMQVAIPQGGLQYEFILRGIMAVAALEIAAKGHPNANLYFRRAMELYDLGSAAFRSQLSNVTKENIEWVFIYSSVVSIINMAMLPNQMRSALDVATTMFELTCGTAILAYKNMDWLLDCPYSQSISYAMTAYDEDAPDTLPFDIRVALQRLAGLVNSFDVIGVFSLAPRKVFDSPTHMYRISVEQLQRCFVEESKHKMHGICTAFPAMVGPDFTEACRQREPMALLILLHWTLLMDQLGRIAWWAEGLARTLAGEIAGLLALDSSELADLPAFRESVEWVMQRLDQHAVDEVYPLDIDQTAAWDYGPFEDLQIFGGNG